MPDPNSHITRSLDCIRQMQSFVSAIPAEADKQRFTSMLYELSEHVVSVSNELAVCEYRISELSRQRFEPVIDAQAGTHCPYIDPDALVNGAYSVEEFEHKLQQACESEAQVLGMFLHKYAKIGYLDFHGESKKKIFARLKDYFPTMRQYGYRNFAAAF